MGAGDGSEGGAEEQKHSEGGAEEQKHKGPGLSSSMAVTVPRGEPGTGAGGGGDVIGSDTRKHRRIGAEVRANSMQDMGGAGS